MTKQEAKKRLMEVAEKVVTSDLQGAVEGKTLGEMYTSTTKMLFDFIEELIESLPEGKS